MPTLRSIFVLVFTLDVAGATAILLLDGCSGVAGATNPLPAGIPTQSANATTRVSSANLLATASRIAKVTPLLGSSRAIDVGSAVYSGYDGVFAYHNFPNGSAPPKCQFQDDANGGLVSADSRGDVMIVDTVKSALLIYAPPKRRGLCGGFLGSIALPTAANWPAASIDALKGTIVASVLSNGAPGLAVCTFKGGCTKVLAPYTYGYNATSGSVALARDGDCWLEWFPSYSYSLSVLTYFPQCNGSGEFASGFQNGTYNGGLLIDSQGNLISIAGFKGSSQPSLDVYQGCSPQCSLVASSPLEGCSYNGGLDATGTELVVADWCSNLVELYSYLPSGITFDNFFQCPGRDYSCYSAAFDRANMPGI